MRTWPQSNFLIQPQHCQSICDLFGWAVTGCEWEGDSGLLHIVDFAAGSCCVFFKSGQEGIRIINKNKLHNGLFWGKVQFWGHKTPKSGTVYSSRSTDARLKIFPL